MQHTPRLDSRGGHENDGGKKKDAHDTGNDHRLPFPAVILAEGGNPVLVPSVRRETRRWRLTPRVL